MQSKWNLESGVINVERDETGEYQITTRDLVITKDELADTVDYVCLSTIHVDDYLSAAPGLIGLGDDIIDMPFTDVVALYYGNLYGYGTANYVVTLYTRDFSENVSDRPGMLRWPICLILTGIYVSKGFLTDDF